MEREQIATILKELQKNYRTFKISDTTQAWWFEALRPYPCEQVFDVIKHWVFRNIWPPTIAEIVEAVENRIAPELTIPAVDAFTDSKNTIGRELKQKLIAVYGSERTWKEDDSPWRFKMFCEMYEKRLVQERESWAREQRNIELTYSKTKLLEKKP